MTRLYLESARSNEHDFYQQRSLLELSSALSLSSPQSLSSSLSKRLKRFASSVKSGKRAHAQIL